MRKGSRRILLDVAGGCLSTILRPSLICARVDEWTGCINNFKDEARRRRIKRRTLAVLSRITFITVTGYKHFTALKVPRQWPLVLLVKRGWRQSGSLGSEEGSVVGGSVVGGSVVGGSVVGGSMVGGSVV